MHTNVNLEAALGVLGFLGSCFCLAVGFLVFVLLVVTRRASSAALVLGAMLLGVCLYFGVLLAFSALSHDTVLARGEEKHFCEIDCHIAYSIADVKTSTTIGNKSTRASAGKTFYIVSIRTRFDETTISSGRGNGLLYPNSRLITIVDASARTYQPSEDGQSALDLSEGSGTPISTPLRPGDSYLTKVVFELPEDIRNPTLLINEKEWITRVIIGHENSFRHMKTSFRIEQV